MLLESGLNKVRYRFNISKGGFVVRSPLKMCSSISLSHGETRQPYSVHANILQVDWLAHKRTEFGDVGGSRKVLDGFTVFVSALIPNALTRYLT